MSNSGWNTGLVPPLRRVGAGLLLALALSTGAAQAQGLVPAQFFNAPVDPQAAAAVEADNLQFDSRSGVITASGDVVLNYSGYTVTGQSLVFNRTSNDVQFTGPVSVRDPSGNVAQTTDLRLTGGMKQAFINALTINTFDGARITADSVDYDAALRTMLTNATYSPCGDCIDAKGRRIGWSVRAARIISNEEDGSLTLEQPSLALLGFPVAWLPYLWLPDTSDTALANLRMPSIDSSEEIGLKVEVPFVAYSNPWTDIILSPALVSRQGALLGAEWIQRFDQGSFRIKASGIYQLEPEAFSFPEARRDWRGAVQTSGQFRPVEDWTVGWSYSAFTDAAFFEDYRLEEREASVNEVYATNVTRDTFIDLRLQQFNLLGDVPEVDQDRQGDAVPNARFNHVERLAPGYGQVEVSARLLGVQREGDHRAFANSVPYVFGFAGDKTHAMLQGGWQTQWIGAGGFVATPYLGGRLDAAYYNGESTLPVAPEETTLWSATPIAAMDVRFPMAASDGASVHLVEPIGQLVYRGSDTSLVGITNDDAQSFVFEDTNLFSFNRFSGSDRQETGLRANVGGRYLADFADGSYLELIAGQSFQLAGENAFASADPAFSSARTGLEDDASYAVLGAYGALNPNTRFGGKLQVDSDSLEIARAGLGASFSAEGYSAGLDYFFIAADPEGGVTRDQHEVGVQVGVPVADYWTVKAATYWDLAANEWLQVSGGVVYDDGYLELGAGATVTGPTHTTPDDTRFTASFRLKAPAGLNIGMGTP
ncbi:MAG: LPS-assembly protein LptD [Devosia sp.]|nr:LPS-assembly protein LptD [Devosia sp.]